MAGYDEALTVLIDQHIRAAMRRDRAIGTCVTRAATGSAATVMFDGSTVAMPVKVLGHVLLRPGGRCVLDLYGTEWLVTGSFATHGMGEANRTGTGPAGTVSITSGSYVDLTDIATTAFTKVYDATFVEMSLSITMRCSGTVPFGARFGYRFTPLDGQTYTPSDYIMNFIRFETVNERLGNTYTIRATDMPAGAYSMQVRWRRVSAAGTGILDSGDLFSININERASSGSPVL